MNPIFKYALMFAFVGIAMFALSQMSDGAEAADCTWKPTSGELASTAANWENGSAPISGDVLYFDDTSIINCKMDIAGTPYYSIVIKSTYSGTVQISNDLYFTNFNINGKISIDTDKLMYVRLYTGYTYNNLGNISGLGKLIFLCYNTDPSISIGDANVNIDITAHSGALASRKLTLTGNIINAKILQIYSSHATYTMTFDANNYNINCHSFSNGTRAISILKNGIMTLGNTGTSSFENAIVNKLIINGQQTFNSMLKANYLSINFPLTLQSYNAQANTRLWINSTFTGRIYYNGTSDISTNQQHWTGWLYTQNDIAIEYNAYAYLAFQHDTWLGIQLESWSGTDNFTWNATSVTSQTVQWSWSRGESSSMYDEYQDTIYIGSSETNAGGMGEFTSTFVGSHAFLLSRSSFLPASTDIDDSVWLGILFMCIATIINFVGYIRKIGLLQIVSFLVLLVGIFAATDVWEELWTLPTLFILTNAVIFMIGMMRRG